MDSLLVRILNGRFGSQPPAKEVLREDLIALDQELCLADIKLHKLCQFIKSFGLKTPPALGTLNTLKKTTEDLFSSVQLDLDQKIQNITETSKQLFYRNRSSERIFCIMLL